MSKIYSPKIVTDSLVMCLDPSQNKSYPTTDLPIKDGLVMWMDAADDATFSYSSGTTVTQWRDKSGYNYHGTPLTAGPTRSSFLNSRKVLAFTTGQSIGNLSFTMETSANTVFVVSRLTGTTNARVLTAYYNNWLLGHWGGLVNPYYAEGWVYYSPNAADTVWRIYMGDWGGPSNDLAAAYSNGTVLTSGSTVASAGPKGLGINFQGGEPSTCEAAEIIVFNRLLSTSERRLVHTYLGQKWGISNTDRSIVNLADSSKNGLLGNGTVANMPLIDYYNKGSLKFDGSNDYVNIGTGTGLNQFSGDFTVSLWAMATGLNSNYGNLIGDYYTNTVATTNEWQIMMNNSSTYLNVYRVGTGYIISNTASGFSANTWINVVLTRIGSAITLYANNTVIATATNSTTFGTATGNFNIGIDGNNTSEAFSGLISNVLIYNKGLTATEVAQNYNAQKSRYTNTIVQQGLVLNLDAANPYSYAGAGTTWFDTSGNANNGTLTNGPTYNTTNSGVINFNGTNNYVTSANSSSLQITSALTLEIWFYNTANADGLGMIVKGPLSSDYDYMLYLSGNSTYVSFYKKDSLGTPYYGGVTLSLLNRWLHIVATHTSGGLYTMYVNGVAVDSAAFASSSIRSSSNPLYIGAGWNPAYFSGNIGETRIYNIALSAAQVLQNYNASKSKFGL